MGVISIVLFLISAIIQGGIVFSAIIGIISLAILIGLPIAFVSRQRKAAGGVITFKEVFVTAFAGLALGTLIYFAFSYIYVNFIDKAYLETLINQQIETTAKFMTGMPEATMMETLTEIETKTRSGYTVLGMTQNFAISLIIYAVYSSILGAIMKKRPLFVSDSEVILDN